MGSSGPEEAIRGIVEDVTGKAKAARDVAKKEAEAEASRAAEKAAEARQKAAE